MFPILTYVPKNDSLISLELNNLVQALHKWEKISQKGSFAVPSKDITTEEANKLLHMEKKIVINDDLQDVHRLSLPDSFFSRLNMQSLDGNNVFLLQLSQGLYNQACIDFHFQENAQYIGLLRIDYNNVHKNPKSINEHVPPIAREYQGQYIYESHLHFYVEGYKNLAWAIPLTVSDFPVKSIQNTENLFSALEAFCSRINLTTKILTEGRLFL